MIRPPLRKVVEVFAASVMLECLHLHNRRAGKSDLDQSKRMRCVVCMPITARRAWMASTMEKRRRAVDLGDN